MKITTLNSAFRTLCIAVMTVTATGASASIPLAGIYEMNDKEDMSKHQMYLELDFINSRPDFTQTFTTKGLNSNCFRAISCGPKNQPRIQGDNGSGVRQISPPHAVFKFRRISDNQSPP